MPSLSQRKRSLAWHRRCGARSPGAARHSTVPPRGPAMIVQELHKIQERCGYLPVEELESLARRIATPLHRIHEVASFYPLYRLQPPATVEVKVCRDMACFLRGSHGLQR